MSIPVQPPFKTVYIQLNWTDKIGSGGKEFYNLKEFADFLNDNPEFKRALKEGSFYSQNRSTGK